MLFITLRPRVENVKNGKKNRVDFDAEAQEEYEAQDENEFLKHRNGPNDVRLQFHTLVRTIIHSWMLTMILTTSKT